MRGSSILALIMVSGLSAQTDLELKSPGDVLKIQPFRQSQPKKNVQPHSFFTRVPSGKSSPVWGPPIGSQAETGVCSIPLLTFTPKPMDRAMATPPPKTSSNMPQIAVPAPPCEDRPAR
jgi:hypothetical protein